MRLDGKVAIVTGGGRGIGKAICLRLAEEGAKVAVAARTLEQVQAVAEEIEANGGTAVPLVVDVSKREDTERMAGEITARFGRIDILINNAAAYGAPIKLTHVYDIDPDEWDSVMAVNVKGPWLCTCASLPQMRKQGSGKIINFSSTVFFRGTPYVAHYLTSKAAIIGLTRVLARELGQYGICVNTVCPGEYLTEGFTSLFPKGYETTEVQQRCIKRKSTLEDLVGTVVFLASDDSNFVTGQMIVVDGGRAMY